MNETLTISNTLGKTTRKRGRYPFLNILAGVAILIAWGLGASGQARAYGATLPQGPVGPAAAMAEGDQPKQAQPSLANDTPGGEYPHSPAGSVCHFCFPAVAYGPGGEYLVVWEDETNSSRFDIYGQRVSSSGALLGNQIAIATASGYQSRPAVAYNGTGNEYLVVWQRADGGSVNVYGQRVSGNGALLGSNFPISTASGGVFDPAVAYNGTGNEYLVVWQQASGGSGDVYGQRVSGSGALLGSNFPISTAADGQYYPTLTYNGTSNEYLVVWQDNRSGTTADIYGQRVSGSGALLGSNFPISTASDHQYSPVAAYNSTSGEYLVVWWGAVSGDTNIYGQRVAGSGALVGSEIPISTATGSQREPAIAYNSTANEYLVVWWDQRGGNNNLNIYGQRVSSSGALVGGEIPISTETLNQTTPAVAYNNTANEYLVVWQDFRDGTVWHIYGQRVSSSGALQGSNFPISIGGPATTATPTATAPPSGCTIEFSDVPQGSTFHPFVKCLACRNILGGYPDGTFRPQNLITRGQIAKIVSNAAGYSDDVSGMQTYADVPSSQTFHEWIERLSMRGHMGGYNCGGPGELCDNANRPYFRPGSNATRGQLSKIVSNAAEFEDTPSGQTFQDVPPSSTFYLYIERLTSRGVMSGYPCGGAGEPCQGGNRPYFRPSDNVTRGQAAKIVANTFFPNCETARP